MNCRLQFQRGAIERGLRAQHVGARRADLHLVSSRVPQVVPEDVCLCGVPTAKHFDISNRFVSCVDLRAQQRVAVLHHNASLNGARA